MSKVLVLVQYRGGSTYFQGLQRNKPFSDIKFLREKERLVQMGFSSHLVFLPTIYPRFFPKEIDGAVNSFSLSEKNKLSDICHFRWHGDWWGQGYDENTIPGPYDIDSEMSFSPKHIKKYISSGWKVISLVRNPLNHAASIFNFHGELESGNKKKYSNKYLLYVFKSLKNKYRMVIDSSLLFPEDYKVIKFEDLLEKPLPVLKETYDFCEIKLNKDVIKTNIREIKNNKRKNYHSSFKTPDFNNRWKSFSQEFLLNGLEILDKEVEELGYEKP